MEEIQNEIVMFRKGFGYYCFRNFPEHWGGQYLFRVHQHFRDSKKAFGKWIDPTPSSPGRLGPCEYFSTRKQALRAMAKAG